MAKGIPTTVGTRVSVYDKACGITSCERDATPQTAYCRTCNANIRLHSRRGRAHINEWIQVVELKNDRIVVMKEEVGLPAVSSPSKDGSSTSRRKGAKGVRGRG